MPLKKRLRLPQVRFTDRQTRNTWVGTMLALSTVDVALHWGNLAVQLSRGQRHGLVYGPPGATTLVLLLVFTVVRTAVYVGESVNTLWVCRSAPGAGTPLVPVTADVGASLLFAHVPLSVLNFTLCWCRANYMSPLQTLAAACQIVLVFSRLVWHAHLRGRTIRAAMLVSTTPGGADGAPSAAANCVFLACCAVLAVSITFPITSWRSQPSTVLRRPDVLAVAVLVCDEDARSADVRAVILADLFAVVAAADRGVVADFRCTANSSCADGERLRFRFRYDPDLTRPYGGIVYNFARLTGDDTRTCDVARTPAARWTLCYRRRQRDKRGRLVAAKPWPNICAIPSPLYDPSLPVSCQ